MQTEKDFEQDRLIRSNAERITRNEEAIKRQTEALEQIRDHYYPPPERWWKKAFGFLAKVICVIFAYLGIAQTVDWLWNARESDSLAENYAKVAQRLFEQDGDILGAISCLEKAYEIDSKESEYLMSLTFLRGMALAAEFIGNDRPPTDEEQARIDSALSEAIVLRELNPTKPLPYVLMAQAYLLSGEKNEAVSAVEQAVARAPTQAFVHVSACTVNYYAGRIAEARAHLAEAERLNSALPLVSVWKGFVALSIDRDTAAARACFEGMTRRFPRFPLGYLFLGRTLLAEKNPDLKRVRGVFSRALVLNAKLKGVMLGMAEAYEREGNLILARLWLDRALVLDASHLSALVVRARICGETGEFAQAERDLTAAIALAPHRADLYRLRAGVREKSGDAAQAAKDRATAKALEEIKE